jgi:hypothetical protein
VIVSLLYQLTRRLLSASAVLLRHDTAKDAELLVLRHENAVLRRQITGQRPRVIELPLRLAPRISPRRLTSTDGVLGTYTATEQSS